MQNHNIEEEIREIIAQIIERDPQEITPEAKFFETLGVDSMMALEMMTAVEKKYKITIPEDKLPTMTSLSEVVRVANEYITQKV